MANAPRPRLFTPVVILFSLFLVAPLLAQEPPKEQPAETQQTEESEDQPFLEEMTVTAQKRAESVQDVPAAVTAMPDAAVETISAGGGDVKALSGRVPSLLIESSFGRAFPRFYIRGLGNTDFDLNASQPVSMIYDEVVMENPVLKGYPIFDVDRVEVLRGPQGTLFGRNTPAGIIKFESNAPTKEFEATVRGSYGLLDTADLKGAISGGLSDTVSARFSFLYQSQSDWVDNLHTGQDDALGGYENFAYRLQLLFEPTVRFKALFNVHGWDVDGTARMFRANILKPGTNDLVDGFNQDEVYYDGLNDQNISSQGGVLKLEYASDNGILTSVTGYETLDMFSRGDIDGGFGAVFAPPFGPGFIPFYSESSDGIPNLDQFTQEIRFASNTGGPLQWIIGAYFFDESFEAETFSYTSLAPGNPVEGFAFQKQDAQSWAGFGSVDYRASDKWKLSAGLRYTHDEKDFSAERPIPIFLNIATIGPVTAKTDDDFANWNLSATYVASPTLNLYGRVATGSRAPSIQGRILFAPDMEGGTNPATNGVSVADTEELLSFEVGAKTELLERRLRLNSAIYVFQVDGQQITAVGGQYNVATLLNADKTDGYGFESDIAYAPNRSWTTTLGISYNKTKIDDPNLTVGPCGGGCAVLDPIRGGLAYVDGNSLPHAPEWIFNGIVDYRRPSAMGEIVGSFDWAYSSKKQFFLYESKEFNSDSMELGLRLGYAWNHGKYEASVFGRNITDEEIVQNGIDFNNLTGMTNDPALWGVEFVARF